MEENFVSFVDQFKPMILGVTASVAVFGAWLLSGRVVARRAAKELVEKQFDQMPSGLIDQLVNDAEDKGNKRQVLALLRMIRTKHGRDGVKYGHLVWIWDILEQDIDPETLDDIPSFARPQS